MDRGNESELIKQLEVHKMSDPIKLLEKLLTLRREQHRDSLESQENPVKRGKAQECKWLIELLS